MRDITSQVQDIRDALDEVVSDIETKTDELNDVLKSVEDANSDFEKRQLEIKDEIGKLGESAMLSKKEALRLKGEVDGLVEKKGKLQVENTRLTTQNDKFARWHTDATKALKAKEASLIQREDALLETESLRPRNTSILPPEL